MTEVYQRLRSEGYAALATCPELVRPYYASLYSMIIDLMDPTFMDKEGLPCEIYLCIKDDENFSPITIREFLDLHGKEIGGISVQITTLVEDMKEKLDERGWK